MRTSQWTLLIASLMFLSSIWFVLAAARTPTAATEAPAAPPAATVRHLMTGLIGPAATTVYRSVSYVVSAEGEKEFSPQNDEEWDVVVGSAAALVEAGELLKDTRREGARDAEAWHKFSQDMIDASLVAKKAAEDRSKTGIIEIGERLNASCTGCHLAYDME